MVEPSNLARHVRQCLERNLEPRIAAADAKQWFLALGELVAQGALAEATLVVQQLTSTFPASAYFRHYAMLLKTMPGEVADPGFAKFADQTEQTVQVVRRAGARAVMLAFCGAHGALGMPLPVAHRWFGLLGTHVVYLRDTPDGFFDSGIPELAEDRAGTERALEGIAKNLGATTVFCYGNSTGGYAALLYGVGMGAKAVVAVNAVIVAPARVSSRRAGRTGDILPKRDLRSLFLNATVRPRSRLVYAASNADDRASAEAMSGIPNVTLEAVEGCSVHDAHVQMIERKHFGPFLQQAFMGRAESDESASRL